MAHRRKDGSGLAVEVVVVLRLARDQDICPSSARLRPEEGPSATTDGDTLDLPRHLSSAIAQLLGSKVALHLVKEVTERYGLRELTDDARPRSAARIEELREAIGGDLIGVRREESCLHTRPEVTGEHHTKPLLGLVV